MSLHIHQRSGQTDWHSGARNTILGAQGHDSSGQTTLINKESPERMAGLFRILSRIMKGDVPFRFWVTYYSLATLEMHTYQSYLNT